MDVADTEQEGGTMITFTDDVRGVVIGDVSTAKHYGFYDDAGQAITTKDCQTDQEAIAWFQNAYPIRYAAGVEMRVWE